MQAHTQDSSLTVAKLGLAQIDLLKGETTNAITLLEGTLQEVSGWLDALKVLQHIARAFIEQAMPVYMPSVSLECLLIQWQTCMPTGAAAQRFA